ncbi:hypothetical protein ACFXAW_02775 [Streptomyces sp. NPDC059445]|uniref:hypothetical protein n=1 Tax=unclassified Streptomyces TaxID=2593676 RepID=UPI0036B00456
MRFGRIAWRSAVTAAVLAGFVSVVASPAASAAGTTAIAGASAARAVQHRDIGDVSYTDFLGGRVTFTQTETSAVRMNGQFNDGFADPNASCALYIGDLAPVDFSGIGATINPPGTSAFQHDFEDTTIDDFIGLRVRVICDNELIAVSDPTVPVE